jgi:maleylpyruvate isomerase
MRADLDRLHEHTDRLLATAAEIDDAHAPSLCDGWTRGHVLTHVARNAEAIERLALWALDGTPREMYPGGTRARDEQIEAGASRPTEELVEDVRSTATALATVLAQWADQPHAADQVEMRGRTLVPSHSLAFLRLREVVFHHVDLAAGFGFDDVEDDLLDRLLDDAVARLGPAAPDLRLELVSDPGRTWTVGSSPAQTVTGTPAGLLLWLARRDESAVRSDDGPVPQLPRGA